jgi:UDPglucose 6-dehydrogenase
VSISIAVVGAGYVGLTTGACLASLGKRIVCADIDPLKVDALRRGEVSIQEPGLTALVRAGQAGGLLEFTVGARSLFVGRPPVDMVFLCVPTPMAADGSADLGPLLSVAGEIRDLLPPGCVVVIKSTVPTGTAARLARSLARDDVEIVSNPEFLREANAVHDFTHPDRIVVGSRSRKAAERVAELYSALGAPTVFTDCATAEMLKYAANCFLAMKVSYVNAIAELCDHFGADVTDVVTGIGLDPRIGSSGLNPGPGWGGPCLPKDTQALLSAADNAGIDLPLVRAAIDTNRRQHRRIAELVRDAVDGSLLGKRICLLGLTFKAGTNDLRESPALAVADLLAAAGAKLVGYDPSLSWPMAKRVGALCVADDPYRAAAGAEVVVVLVDWPEFLFLDWAQLGAGLTGGTVIDTRNQLDPETLRDAGLRWVGLGKPDQLSPVSS